MPRLPYTTLVVHIRESYGQDIEIAKCFVVLSVVYHDGTFKVAASDL